MKKTAFPKEVEASVPERQSNNLNVTAVSSPVLARLIEEVRNERAEGPHAYNRMHNRHNRSR